MDKLYLTILCIFIYESECVVPYNDVKADYETLLSAYRVRKLSLYLFEQFSLQIASLKTVQWLSLYKYIELDFCLDICALLSFCSYISARRQAFRLYLITMCICFKKPVLDNHIYMFPDAGI